MNTPLAVEAVAGVQGAQGPLSTLHALAEAVGALASMPGAPQPAPQAEMALPEPVLSEAGSPALQAAQATQGRMTLHQLAAEQRALRPAASEAAPAPAIAPLLRGDIAADGLSAPRLPDAVVVPVMVSALHAQAATPSRVQAPPPGRAAPPQEDASMPTWPDADQAAAPAPEPEDTERLADPEAAALLALLQRAGQTAALAELQRGRRVLLVLPQAGATPGMAAAWLLSATRAQRHAARWWPGAATDQAWPSWRVFRDGDPQLGRGLASRAAGVACRVGLGVQPPRLVDPGAARLEIAERIRFAQALGGQWSLLLLAAPAGTEPA